jgi:tRNA U34 5-carboxymethylaminomethyl modifying GTPase MnmE/TrmE
MNMSPTSQRISEIIQKRKALAENIIPTHQHLSYLREELISLYKGCQELKNLPEYKSGVDTKNDSNFLSELQLREILSEIQKESAELKNLYERFARQTLNIGVIGRMRQGKSTFLQQLSGLTDDEIPALQGAACTAVRSRIYHHDKETRAIVDFHSEKSFLDEVIAPYYKRLGLESYPKSL